MPARAQAANQGGRRRQGAVARGAAQGRAVRGRASSTSSPAALMIYGIIGALALAGVWFFNVDNVYADMRFNQGQGLSDSPNSGLEQQLVGMTYYLDAIRMEPGQDFYYLNLGRTLMNLTDIKRQTNSAALGQPKPTAQLSDLLRMTDEQQVQEYVFKQAPLETMSYAQAVLEDARELNTLNKDHYANLARMHSFWYSRLTQDPDQLRQSIEWYKQGHEVAPQDVTILNEYASTVALMGNYTRSHNDEPAAQQYYGQAAQLLAQSKALDARYSDTDLRLADVLRLQGNASQAVDMYLKLLEANPHALDSQVTQIADSLRDQPDLLRRLRDAYMAAAAKKPDDAVLHSYIGLISVRLNDMPQAAAEFGRWTQLQPQSLEAHRNYTLVLSDTRQYTQALAEAQTLLGLAQAQQLPQEQQGAIQGLVEFLKQQSAGG
jgi:tetratricopeptide (TPR) repeat protein